MESTGVYWIPLFGVLEERGFQVMLVDPRRIKNVPGRRTCWTASGCSSCTPTDCCREPSAPTPALRSYLRQRVMLVQYASHMQKALTQMNQAPPRHQ